MKILIIQPWISYRGAESVSLEEARGLNKLGYGAAILCLFVDKERLRESDKQLNFIVPPDWLAFLLRRSIIIFYLIGFWVLLAMIVTRGRKFDIYNPHNFPAVWVAVIVAAFTKKRVVWTVHNFPQHGFVNPAAAALWQGLTGKIDYWLVQRVDGIVCVSEKVGALVKKIYGKEAGVVYPPVDFDFFDDERKLKSAGKDAALVLIPTKLHKFKNVFFAMEVVEKFVNDGGMAKFVVAGEGNQMAELMNYCRINDLEKTVVFLGFIQKDKLRKFYGQADLVFLPADFGEGFNICVLEALCAGTPSLVLKDSGVDRWMLTNKVGFVAGKDVARTAGLLKKLLDNKAGLRETGKRGRDLVKKAQTAVVYAEELMRLFTPGR